MKADGSGATRITQMPSDESSPKWSPDGKRITFFSDKDLTYGIYVKDAEGANLTYVSNGFQSERPYDWAR